MTDRIAISAQMITGGGYSVDDGLGENYESLSIAIIGQAVKDYDLVLEQLYAERNPRKRIALFAAKAEIESFLHSGWFSTLSDMDPDYLISRTREISMRSIKQKIRNRHRKEVAAKGGPEI